MVRVSPDDPIDVKPLHWWTELFYRALWALTPGEHTQVVICGFPRSGSTLLQSWLEAAVPHAVSFHRERPALRVMRSPFPFGRWRITKRPHDIHQVGAIRALARRRGIRVRFLVTDRDPRAVLTSRHGESSDYYVSVGRWQADAAAADAQRGRDDVCVVTYKDLIQRPSAVQAQIEWFIGCTAAVSLTGAHKTIPKRFNAVALNGVRPLDPSRLEAWRAPEHAARVAYVTGAPAVVAYLARH